MEISVGVILSSGMAEAPIPDDKKKGCLVTLVKTKNDEIRIKSLFPSANEPTHFSITICFCLNDLVFFGLYIKSGV